MAEKKHEKSLGIFTDQIIESQLQSQGPLPISFQRLNQQQFYEEYKRVCGISYEINEQLKVQNLLKQELMGKVSKLETNARKNENSTKKRLNAKKRNRRGAQDIVRKWKCSIKWCDKQYGSQSSLIQHVKLKHPEVDEEWK